MATDGTAEAAYQFAELRRDGPVAIVTMNRPERLNALSEELELDVCAALLAAEADASVRAIVLAGAGRAFCSGHDLQAGREREPASGVERAASVRRRNSRLLRATLYNHKPVIARVHGFCLVAGADLASGCDFIVSSDDATFGYPILRTVPRVPSTLWPWQIGIPRTKELLFTGDMISAQRALTIGLVNHVVPREELESFTHRIAMRVALGASKRAQKRWLNGLLSRSPNLSTAMESVYDAWEPETDDEIAAEWGARLRAGGVARAVRWRKDRFRPYE